MFEIKQWLVYLFDVTYIYVYFLYMYIEHIEYHLIFYTHASLLLERQLDLHAPLVQQTLIKSNGLLFT